MAFLQQGSDATVTIPANQSIRVGAFYGAVANVTIPSGLTGSPITTVTDRQSLIGPFPAGATVSVLASKGNVEYVVGSTPVLTSQIYNPSSVLSVAINNATQTTLTNPNIQAVNSQNGFTQIANQNKSTGASSSADFIAYPDNSANDLTGFVDIGITSSTYADAAYTVTTANEAYLFGSAPSGASKSGDLVIATDSTGTTNAIRFYTNGFNKAIGAFAARILSSGLFTFNFGRALVGSSKVVVNNGATTTYTVPAGASYVNITTSAASLAFTFPAAAATIDGLEIAINPSASVATATWASSGATFVGAPSALVANTTVRFIYHHATTQWFQA